MDRKLLSVFKVGLQSIGGKMFTFGKRKIIKQGNSSMISLPVQWLRSVDQEIKTVVIEMDSKKRLRIVAGDTRQDTTGFDDTHGCEYQ